jgi:hypothetical protein
MLKPDARTKRAKKDSAIVLRTERLCTADTMLTVKQPTPDI